MWEEKVSTKGTDQMTPLVTLSAVKSSVFTIRDNPPPTLRTIPRLNSSSRGMREVFILFRRMMKNNHFLQVFIKMGKIISKMKVTWKMISFKMRMTSEMMR